MVDLFCEYGEFVVTTIMGMSVVYTMFPLLFYVLCISNPCYRFYKFLWVCFIIIYHCRKSKKYELVSVILATMFLSGITYMFTSDRNIQFVFRTHTIYSEYNEELGSEIIGSCTSNNCY